MQALGFKIRTYQASNGTYPENLALTVLYVLCSPDSGRRVGKLDRSQVDGCGVCGRTAVSEYGTYETEKNMKFFSLEW